MNDQKRENVIFWDFKFYENGESSSNQHSLFVRLKRAQIKALTLFKKWFEVYKNVGFLANHVVYKAELRAVSSLDLNKDLFESYLKGITRNQSTTFELVTGSHVQGL